MEDSSLKKGQSTWEKLEVSDSLRLNVVEYEINTKMDNGDTENKCREGIGVW